MVGLGGARCGGPQCGSFGRSSLADPPAGANQSVPFQYLSVKMAMVTPLIRNAMN